MNNVVVWLQQELRTRDHPALALGAELAAARGGKVLPLYILDTSPKVRAMGRASRWWVHHALARLQIDVPGLVLRRGATEALVPELVREVGASDVVWPLAADPAGRARDAQLAAALQAQGVTVHAAAPNLLCPPGTVRNGSGADFKVFTPFWKACLGHLHQYPPKVRGVADFRVLTGVASDRLEDWELLPTKPNWAAGWENVWQPGEAGAWARLEGFLAEGLRGYAERRDHPALPHTSRLSPHLHFGEISVREIFETVQQAMARQPELTKDGEKFLAELGWREFAHDLHHHFPALATRSWRSAFEAYPWRHAPEDLAKWQQGLTGYPLVDAGMRQLWRTGWQHNRVRMVCASFLIKHLRLDWRLGEQWYWDTLVDADAANNAASWQWVAGSGADASPYFRIFNPFGQGQKFDTDGAYVRQWCPELAKLPNEFIHTPWEAPPMVLAAAGVELGVTYPQPMVQHEAARAAALAGFERVKGAG